MADQTNFKHITVNPAEPDDIVIHAGAPQGETQPEPAIDSNTVPASSEPAPSVAGPTPSKGSSQGSPTYHPTTLDDIQGFKMSKTQIAVIVVALAAIVAAVVWYLVFS